MTLAELQALLHERGVAVCIGTVWRFFERRSKPDRSRVTYGGHIICYWTALTIFAAQMDKFGYHRNGRWSNLAISDKKL